MIKLIKVVETRFFTVSRHTAFLAQDTKQKKNAPVPLGPGSDTKQKKRKAPSPKRYQAMQLKKDEHL